MRKGLILLLLILFSCQPEELVTVQPLPQYEMVFEEEISSIVDGQEISFDITVEEKHWLIIELNSSVVAKESFLPQAGLNTRKIYTKALPKEELILVLKNNNQEFRTKILIQ